MLTTLDKYDDSFTNGLHSLFQLLIPEYVKLAKHGMYDYQHVKLYVNDNDTTAVKVFYKNYLVGKVEVVNTNTGVEKLILVPNYTAYDGRASVNYKQMAKKMMQLFATPTPYEEVSELAVLVEERARACVSGRASAAEDSYNIASKRALGAPHYHGWQSPLLGRVIALLELGGVDRETLHKAFEEWRAEDVPEKVRLYNEAVTMRDRAATATRMRFRSRGPLLPDSALVRIWSDGSGVLLTGCVRHCLENAMEMMPAEVSTKVAMLKVSGLDMIAGTGVNGGTYKVHEALDMSVYFIVRD